MKAKLEQIVRDEMAAAGAHEVHFPALLPREPYEATASDGTSTATVCSGLQDRHGADYLRRRTRKSSR